MTFAYDDIILLKRPVHDGDVFSRRHPRMARQNRAKLFAPFAALTGFESAVRAKEIPYVPRRFPDPEQARTLDRTLNELYLATRTGPLARQNRVRVRVTYFEPCADPNSESFGQGGLYRSETGILWRVDPVGRSVTVGGREIAFEQISALARIGGRLS